MRCSTWSVVQGVRSNYETDLFTPLLAKAGEIAKVDPNIAGEILKFLPAFGENIAAFLSRHRRRRLLHSSSGGNGQTGGQH